MSLGPFRTGQSDGHVFGATTADERIAMARKFNRDQCMQAMGMKHLQSTVRAAVARRLRQLEREQPVQVPREKMVNVAIPAELHRRLKIEAAVHNLTIQMLVEHLVETGLRNEDIPDEL